VCATTYITPSTGNGSFELPNGDDTAIPTNWSTWNAGSAGRGLQNTAGYNFDAAEGTHFVKIDKPVGVEWHGFDSNIYSYTLGETLTVSGSLNVLVTLGSSTDYYTCLQVKFYNDSDAQVGSTQESLHWRDATGGWTTKSMTASSSDAGVTKYRVTVVGGGPSDGWTNNLYWDNVSAVPEPSSVAFFGIGLLGLIGAGWKKFKK